MSDANLREMGRLAMRQEGDWWVAYYAMPGTMENAIDLGRIQMRFVIASRDRMQTFMGVMREGVADIIEEKFGVRPTWGSWREAPESERSGSA